MDPLDFYYAEARYPNALVDVIPTEFYSVRDSDQAIDMAEAVVSLVRELIGIDDDHHPEGDQA